MRRAERLVQQFRRERGWTRELVAATPEASFGWAPARDAFSCGGIVVHLIHAEIFWRRLFAAALAKAPYDPFGLTGMPLAERYESFRPRNEAGARMTRYGSTFAECLASWEPIADETAAAIAAFSDDALDTATGAHPVAGLEASLGDMVLTFFSHESHHRGQLSAYLKMLGVPQPPLFTERWRAHGRMATLA